MSYYCNQQVPIGINYQQPYQQAYNSGFNKSANYEIEKWYRQAIRQDLIQEYDDIVNEARALINEITKHQGNTIARDSQNIYLILNSKSLIKKLDDLGEIKNELSSIFLREVEIVLDTANIVKIKNNNPQKIYIPLYLIPTRIEPLLIFDIYDNTKNGSYYFNLFTYSNYLIYRLYNSIPIDKQELENVSKFSFQHVPLDEKAYYIELTEKYFIKLFLNAMTLHNNSAYIEEWVTYFFKTLRRVKNNLVFIGNKDVSKEMFYDGIMQQIFGHYNCVTITDYMLENLTIDIIVGNKLFVHIDHIPENEATQKKLKDLIESLIVYDMAETTKFMCQIIFTLEHPHPFLNDFLSHSKVFFVDSMDNVNMKLYQPDRVSLLSNITRNLDPFSQQLAALDYSLVKQHDSFYYIDFAHHEVQNQRGMLIYSPKIVLNDTVKFKEKDYVTDNEFFKDWIRNPELMKLAMSNNSKHPILNPSNDSFDKIIPKEDRYKHTYITGKTGSGKSELIKTLIYRDILNDDCSVILLDIYGDLAQSIAKLVDKERLVFINPDLEKDMTPTINLFQTDDKSDDNIEQVSQMVTSVISDINVGDGLSGGMLDVLENCISALIENDKQRDFYDLKRFMKTVSKATRNNMNKEDNYSVDDDSDYNKLLSIGMKSNNEFIREYFKEEFRSVPNNTIQAVRRRLNKILKDGRFSNLTNGNNTINLEAEMNAKGKIIIFNIPKSKMLNTYKYYIKFIIGLIQIIALKRADRPEKLRPHTHLYIDEFHNFITPAIEEILTESRKYKLFLTLVHQAVSQIKDSDLRDIILSNTNVKIIGQNSNKTLEAMNKTLNVKLEDVESLSVGEFYISAGTNDIIKIQNSDKLLGDKGAISNEQWEEHKQYQLEHYYRPIMAKQVTSKHTEEELDKMIDEFINAIKTKDENYFGKLKDTISENEYQAFKDNFSDKYDGADGYILQPKLSLYFNAIYGKKYFEKNIGLLEKLKSKDDFFKQNVKNNNKYKEYFRYKISTTNRD
ncbi:MAG: hypothetical protein A2525_04475 [Sulfurimonas sp. RIFOXYD12_FULL_36_11]|nr:MAG: hypothetical protein A2525_04475 [Sulfurimonas sp. RIFOXYD12_FULL_36_11]